ncbi:MAG: type II toxin-antitoxin system Phd/YefM family antitoxin [Deltaproteobacteria bacterium]|nr:type II toxin-antitoxin system Phd/YefM family antitoxin [Deltaproteobacteria bacterium]MBI3294177.1 type II toxin-antitoxin system Phd/YefM family antitoxin [Deltaproteobacteria bacterium]
MKLNASRLRANIYRLLDQVLKTGRPIEIVRKGRTIRISALERVSKLDRLERREGLSGDPEELVHMDWSKHWKPKLP